MVEFSPLNQEGHCARAAAFVALAPNSLPVSQPLCYLILTSRSSSSNSSSRGSRSGALLEARCEALGSQDSGPHLLWPPLPSTHTLGCVCGHSTCSNGAGPQTLWTKITTIKSAPLLWAAPQQPAPITMAAAPNATALDAIRVLSQGSVEERRSANAFLEEVRLLPCVGWADAAQGRWDAPLQERARISPCPVVLPLATQLKRGDAHVLLSTAASLTDASLPIEVQVMGLTWCEDVVSARTAAWRA